MKVYTKRGDDGTTGLLFGGRVRKDAPAPTQIGHRSVMAAIVASIREHAIDADARVEQISVYRRAMPTRITARA